MDGERAHLMRNDGGEALKRKQRRAGRCNRLVLLVILLLCVVVIAVPTAVILSKKDDETPTNLPSAVKSDNIRKHLQMFQDIAIANNNSLTVHSRSVLDGYNESAFYVTEVLEAKGYQVTHQYFQLPLNYESDGSSLSTSFQDIEFNFVQGTQFNVLRYSGHGTINTTLWVNTDVQGGCRNDTFTDIAPGQVALLTYVSRDIANCSFYDLALNAYQHGAGGIIIAYGPAFASSAPSRTRITGPNMQMDEIIPLPMFSVSYAAGEQLKQMNSQGALTMNGFSNTEVVPAYTFNVLATLPRGNPGTTIVVGSHLDSVPAGPGINDNGSGSSVNLELALQFADLDLQPKNKVMFAWWGAEEWGLVGSRHFVNTLSAGEKANISLNLNMDMLGSPNYFRGVYNGTAAPAGIETQSEAIMRILEETFCEKAVPYEILPFTGRSDYGPFIDDIPPIPAGAVATGADGSKTQVERKEFGGFANVPYDTCYHQACDTIDNVDFDVLQDMADSVATALQVLLEEENMAEFLMQSTQSYEKATSCIREKGSNPVIRDQSAGTATASATAAADDPLSAGTCS
ncbi:aminopeptidase-like [Sycon ciliatum]|uniref:aminopeptidase-like n=1 Tax=Sycon ciliatum TaxID=27933 RepID=UPI0031F5FF01